MRDIMAARVRDRAAYAIQPHDDWQTDIDDRGASVGFGSLHLVAEKHVLFFE